LRNSNENEILIINKTVEENYPTKINKYVFENNDNKWKDELIINLNKCLKNIKLSSIDNNESIISADLSLKDNFLILFCNNELFCIDIKSSTSSLKVRKMYKNDYFIKTVNLINGKKKLFYPIEETNDFIGINNLKQIVHLSISNDFKIINEKILVENCEKLGLFKNILFFESNNEIKVYNLKNGSIIFNQSFSKNKIQFATISDDCEYLATFEESRLLSIFRLSDSKRIANVPIYNEINSILMSDHYVIMCMQDKRILSYLLVDPIKPEHSNRISELDSRFDGCIFIIFLNYQFYFFRNIKKNLTKKQKTMNNLIISKINDVMDGSSDDDEIGDEIFTSNYQILLKLIKLHLILR
jgi:hypothetical protein